LLLLIQLLILPLLTLIPIYLNNTHVNGTNKERTVIVVKVKVKVKVKVFHYKPRVALGVSGG
jgi:hypothetical protein